MRTLSVAILATTALCAPSSAWAEAWAASEDAILVKGQLINAHATAYSATTLDKEAIRKEAQTDIDDLLRTVPGMAVRDYGMPSVASSIVIRGFGEGGHGGDLGAVLDGIPLNEAMSHADGYVDLNIMVPLELGSLTVFRGPVSALYGNYNRGGLVKLETRKGGDYLDADLSFGSRGSGDLQMALGETFKGGTLNLAGQMVISDGYRPYSDFQRLTLAGRVAFDLSPDINLAVSGRYHNADANSASYLTLAQFEEDPYGIDPNVQNDGAKKTFSSARTDLSIALSPSVTLVTYAYVTEQDFTRWFSRPRNADTWRQREEAYDRTIFGAGSSLNGTWDAGFSGGALTYVVGAEVIRESTDFIYHDDLINRRKTGPAISDRRTKLNSLSGFAEIQAPFHALAQLSLGGRVDRFTGGCSLRGPEAGDDPCGKLNSVTRFSPKIGLRSAMAPWLETRISYSEGFSLPNEFVKYSIGGQPLDPITFHQSEIGVKLTPISGITFDVSLYRLNSSGEIRTIIPGEYENYGKTRREGIETSLEWQVTNRLNLRGVYNYAKTDIRQSEDSSIVGNRVAGVPAHMANIDAAWQVVDGWTIGGNWRYVGRYAANASNVVMAKAYDTFDLTLAHEGTFRTVKYRAYLRAENLADNTYVTSVSQIGGQTIVAPGAPRTVRAGLQLSL